MKKDDIRKATEQWIAQFSEVPGSVIEKLAEADEAILVYTSDTFRLIAGPRIRCLNCDEKFAADASPVPSHEAACRSCCAHGSFEFCEPEYAFPCGWGTLFTPNNSCDRQWLLDHCEDVGLIGFYVFESEDYGVLLGIDAGGFDFYEAYWMPLYKLRGLRWHEKTGS